MKSQTRVFLIAAASFAATVGMLIPSSAAAGYSNHSAANCVTTDETVPYDRDPDGEVVVTGGTGTILSCSLMNDDEHPVTALDEIRVFLEDKSTLSGGLVS
jgi:hypothetical protein